MKLCNTFYHNQSVRKCFIIFLQVSALMLEGSSTSYAQFAKWFTNTNSSLELEFRTREPDGLLLYLDDGGYYDFLELKLVSGGLRCRFNFGSGAETLALGRALNTGAWHRVELGLLQDKLTLTLDMMRKSQNLQNKEQDFMLGNFTINSAVYIGGLPPWYSSKLKNLALPSVVFEPRFRGEIRNVIYADSEDGNVKQQQMMAFKVCTSSHCPDFFNLNFYNYKILSSMKSFKVQYYPNTI